MRVEMARHTQSWRRPCLLMSGLMVALGIGSQRLEGCGPDFPNWILSQGDKAVLVAPEAHFATELFRMKLARPRVRANPPELPNNYAAQSRAVELADLRRALKQAGVAPSAAEPIIARHERQRQLLEEAHDAQEVWDNSHSGEASSSATERPLFPAL